MICHHTSCACTYYLILDEWIAAKQAGDEPRAAGLQVAATLLRQQAEKWKREREQEASLEPSEDARPLDLLASQWPSQPCPPDLSAPGEIYRIK
jgi:hypothetical protein